MTMFGRDIGALAGLVFAIMAASVSAAPAADTIRVGKASATTFAFAPLEIGTEKGIWSKYGLAVESIAFGSDARLQQAMVANSIDFSRARDRDELPRQAFGDDRRRVVMSRSPWG